MNAALLGVVVVECSRPTCVAGPSILMGRERAARKERRKLYTQLCKVDGLTVSQRCEPTPTVLGNLFDAIDSRDFNSLGVRQLATLALDGLHPMPAVHTFPGSYNELGFERRITLLGYAAWRRRHSAVKSLLISGANGTVSERLPHGVLWERPEDQNRLECLLSNRHGGATGLQSAVAVHVVECISRMRAMAARDASSLGACEAACAVCAARGQTVCFDPCGCEVCESCVWHAVLHWSARSDMPGEVRGEVHCPQCGALCPSRGHGKLVSERHGAGVRAVTRAQQDNEPAGFDSFRCECCLYTNFLGRSHCRNCAALRPPLGGHCPPPSLRSKCMQPERAGCATGGWASRGVLTVDVLLTRRRPLDVGAGHDVGVVGSGGSGGSGVFPTCPQRTLLRGSCVVSARVMGELGDKTFVVDEGTELELVLDLSRLQEQAGHEVERDTSDALRAAAEVVATPARAAPSAEAEASMAEAQLVASMATVGDRLRTTGRIHPRVLADDSRRLQTTCQWVMSVEAAALLRPLVRPLVRPPCWLGVGEDGTLPTAASATAASEPTTSEPSAAQSMGVGGGAIPQPALIPALKPKGRFRALAPREAAISQLGALGDEQRRESAACAAADGDVCRLEVLDSLGFAWKSAVDDYGQTVLLSPSKL